MLRKILVGLIAGLICGVISYGQFTDCSTGLLQMPTAEIQEDGTFMITNNFINKHSLPTTHWGYNTFQYGIGLSLWGRLELGYVCTIFNGAWDPNPDKNEYWTIMRNQDRHFWGRLLLLREGEFGLSWMPALVIGVSDPTTANGYNDYVSSVMGGGYFNRNYLILTKHFQTRIGTLGVHAGYQLGLRLDYRINAPCAGVNWQPVWLQQKGILDNLNLIAEYDSRTFNLGMIASIWQNRFEAMFELQNFRWINFGLRYKLRLKRVIAG